MYRHSHKMKSPLSLNYSYRQQHPKPNIHLFPPLPLDTSPLPLSSSANTEEPTNNDGRRAPPRRRHPLRFPMYGCHHQMVVAYGGGYEAGVEREEAEKRKRESGGVRRQRRH
ncbi:hypothetical protein Hanom_Chr11g01012271 [Helianthus anomalus]